jgi:hypothetical protein
MWDWYAQSKECLAFLKDVPAGSVLAFENHQSLAQTDWLQLGWILRELIAPSTMLFCDTKLKLFSEKKDSELSVRLAEATKIPVVVSSLVVSSTTNFPLLQE